MHVDNLPFKLIQGEVARLIPVGSEKALERRATSIFLATLSIVEEYASAILGSVGQKLGSRAKLECYTEVVLEQDNKKQDRPDGLIVLRTGKRVWTALVEAKIGNAELDAEQVQRYITIAKQNKIDAVITISNQFAALPTHHPIKLTKSAMKSVELFHWSWLSLRTQASYKLDVEHDIDPEQRYILGEFKRYFEHTSSGVKSFDSMNSDWKNVCATVKNGGKLGKASEEVKSTVGAWYQEQRDLSLLLTQELKAPVSIKLKKAHKNNPELRLKDDCAELADLHYLSSCFSIPDAANDLLVLADLTRRTVTASMEIAAPGDRKSTKARVNWLLRQLSKSEGEDIQVQARWPGRVQPTSVSLKTLREDPAAIQCDNEKLVPLYFQLMLVRDLAGKFSGPKTFLEGMNKAVTDFYQEAGEHLKVWVPSAPKLPKVYEEGGEMDEVA